MIPLYYQAYSIAGFGGVGQDASGNSVLNRPSGVVVDASGNIFFSDTMNHCIRRLDTSGNVLRYAGTGVPGYANGGIFNAQFNQPTALAIDSKGTIYVADTFNNAIRIVEKNFRYDPSGNLIGLHGVVGTLIGNGFNNTDPTSSLGTGTGLLLRRPKGVAVDSSGCVYISDTGNHRICKVAAGGNLVTLAGSATLDGPLSYKAGVTDGEGTNAAFNGPTGLCVDQKGNVYVADTLNSLIRRVTPSGKVSTIAGNGQPFYKEGRRTQASFNYPTGICVDLYNVLYVADTGNHVIRRITNEGSVLPVVGSPVQKSGALDGYGAMDPRRALVPFSNRATFNSPAAIFVGKDRLLYVADTLNNKIRRIIPTFSTPTDIKPIAMQALRITHAPGVAYTLGPTLSAPPAPPNTILYGHQRGSRR
jgi:sugar lactone lactonase YvrE